MSVKAKFLCNQVINFNGGSKEAHMSAVYSQEGENADFAKATPYGELKIRIDGGTPAVDYFIPGKFYYLNFTKVVE